MDFWAAGDSAAPDGWTISGSGAAVAKETTTYKGGPYAAKITSPAGATAYLYQPIETKRGLAYWKGKTVTFGCWVWCDTANIARIQIDANGVESALSSYHTGNSTWQWLTVTMTVTTSASLTALWATCFLNAVSKVAYFDCAIIRETSSIASTVESENWEMTSVTFSGLDGDTDEEYELRCRIVNGYSGSCYNYITFNSDTTAGNYGNQRFRGYSTVVAADRNTSAVTNWFLGNNSLLGQIVHNIVTIFAKSGYIRTGILEYTNYIGANKEPEEVGLLACVWNNSADNITQIVINASQTGGIGVGSVIELYRKVAI